MPAAIQEANPRGRNDPGPVPSIVGAGMGNGHPISRTSHALSVSTLDEWGDVGDT
jgi:hypothetical protein